MIIKGIIKYFVYFEESWFLILGDGNVYLLWEESNVWF